MAKNCGNCQHYEPLKGEPPAGYCEYIEVCDLPFWLADNAYNMAKVRSAKNDVVPTDGAECDTFRPKE